MSVNLRLRRLVRTPHSEQFALYRADASTDATAGKIDLHFTHDGVFGTLLVWDEELLAWDEEELEDFLRGLVEDLVEPQGMAEMYAVECFAPALETYRFFTNAVDEETETAVDEEGTLESAEEFDEQAVVEINEDLGDEEEDILVEEDE